MEFNFNSYISIYNILYKKNKIYQPVVYFDITSGKAICNGINGTAINPNRSFGIPASTSFNVITLSVAENPILDVSNITTNNCTGFNWRICKSDVYAVLISRSGTVSWSLSFNSVSFLSTATIVVVATNTQPQNTKNPDNDTIPTNKLKL